MTKVSILFTENIVDFKQLLRHLSSIDISDFQVELVFIQNGRLEEENLGMIDSRFQILEIPYPEDEDLLFRDILDKLSGEYIFNYNVELVYPADYLKNLFEEEEPKDHSFANRAPYIQRLLKAVQQSKYGMGIVKEDIKRDYPEFKTSAAYKISEFTTLNFLELELNENFIHDLYKMANRSSFETKSYTPNYKSIKYFTDIASYKKAVKAEAPSLSFKNKPNAIGLPLYMMIFIVLSVLLSPFMITAVFPLLVMSAIYLLALTLESLSISAIKKQGDIFLGLMLLFPLLHIYYLWAWISQLGRK